MKKDNKKTAKKVNSKIEELKAIAAQFVEKAEKLTIAEVKEQNNILSVIDSVNWWIEAEKREKLLENEIYKIESAQMKNTAGLI